MSQLRLLDKTVEEDKVEAELASTVVSELTDILEHAERPATDGDYWHYSIPLAGVRYYGFPELSSPERL